MKNLSKNKKIAVGVCAAAVLLAIVVAAALIGGGSADKQEAKDEEEYAITFDANGGSFLEGVTVKAGEKLAEPETPVREGYTFDGWITEDGEKFDFSAAIDKDIRLKASWKKNEAESSGGVKLRKARPLPRVRRLPSAAKRPNLR